MQERCQIVVNTEKLADIKGLDRQQVRCPVEFVCDGTSCILYPNTLSDGKVASPKERFTKRLEKTVGALNQQKTTQIDSLGRQTFPSGVRS